jgi:hypothetical protein
LLSLIRAEMNQRTAAIAAPLSAPISHNRFMPHRPSQSLFQHPAPAFDDLNQVIRVTACGHHRRGKAQQS